MSARQEIVGDPRNLLWTWERDDGTVRYTPATTACWTPVLPWRLRAEKEGFWTILPCRLCLGCLRYQCLLLARRLLAFYGAPAAVEASSPSGLCLLRISNKVSSSASLFKVRVYCPQEQHVAMSRRMHRWRGVQIEPGFCRAGTDSFVVLSREPTTLVERLRRRGVRVESRPMKKLRQLSTWLKFVNGLIVSRDTYGEDINRFFFFKLPPAPKEKFIIGRIHEYKGFNRSSDRRAFSESLGGLVPNKMRKLQRGDSLRVRTLHKRATSPEAVDALVPRMLAIVNRVADNLTMKLKPAYQENADEAEAHLQTLKSRAPSIVVAAERPPNLLPPLSEGGYASSLQDESFEERRKRRYEAMMNAPPTITAYERAEEERRQRAENASTGSLAQRAQKKWQKIRESFRKKGEEAKRNAESHDAQSGNTDRPSGNGK